MDVPKTDGRKASLRSWVMGMEGAWTHLDCFPWKSQINSAGVLPLKLFCTHTGRERGNEECDAIGLGRAWLPFVQCSKAYSQKKCICSEGVQTFSGQYSLNNMVMTIYVAFTF